MRHAAPVLDQSFIARLIDQSAVRAKVGTGDVPLKWPASKFATNRLDFVLRMLFRESVIACLFQCDPLGLLRGHIWNFERVATETDACDLDAKRALPPALSWLCLLLTRAFGAGGIHHMNSGRDTSKHRLDSVNRPNEERIALTGARA